MSPPNKFAAALKKENPTPPETATEAAGAAVADPPVSEAPKSAPTQEKPSRRHTKHIGGYFDPAVSRQLRGIALEEDSTVQELMGQALDMLFQSRRKPTIASRAVQD